MPPKKKEKKEAEPLFPAPLYVGEVLNCFTCDFTRLSNLHHIDDTTVLTACGNMVLLVDIQTGAVRHVVRGRDGGGVGSVCAHPDRTCFAVAEKVGSQSAADQSPNVYVYSYPERELIRTLRGGTEGYYTAAAFSGSGDKLATVGGDPDYMLTVWNWQAECVILRFKAWGSEVFRVTFNRHDDGYLTTSGNGHIKFWEMARTFTGLKLQGAIGKFGKTDIQDIVGYTELPDGKVLSGSQTGELLMWEGNLLKVEIRRASGPCHDGPIEYVTMLEERDEETNEVRRVFMSAGSDGYIRYWRFADIDMADATDGVDGYSISCLKEVLVHPTCKIRYMDRGRHAWVIQDANGAYWNTPLLSVADVLAEDSAAAAQAAADADAAAAAAAAVAAAAAADAADGEGDAAAAEKAAAAAAAAAQAQAAQTSSAAAAPAAESTTARKLVSKHAGAILCVEASPVDYTCATGGSDGTIRLWDFLHNKEIYSAEFSAAFTHLQWLPCSVDESGCLLVAGFGNGVVRTLRKTRTEFELCAAYKPHTEAVTAVAFNADFSWAVTTSADGCIFFFRIVDLATEWVPVGESRLPAVGSSAFWDEGRVVVGLESGQVVSVACPDPKTIDPLVSFVFECEYQTLKYLQRPKPPEKPQKTKALAEDEEEGEDDDEDGDGGDDDESESGEGDDRTHAVSGVLRLPQSLGKQLVVAMENKESVYTYTGISWGPLEDTEMQAEDPIQNVSHVGAIVRSMKLSPMGTYLMMCCNNGTVLLRDAIGKGGVSALRRCWHMHLGHDGRSEVRQGGVCLPGTVNGVALSFDESVLLTVSDDGSFLAQSLKGVPDAAEVPPPSILPREDWPAGSGEEVADITARDALSIQQMKDKDDRDRAAAAAELKKMTLKEKVQKLQVTYQAIVDDNHVAPQGKSMNTEELELDPEITQLLHDENQMKIDQLVERWAWDSAKASIAKQKLEDSYINCLKVDRIELLAFASGKGVSSFRTPALTPQQQEKIDNVHQLITHENARRNKVKEQQQAQQQEQQQQQQPPGDAASAPNAEGAAAGGATAPPSQPPSNAAVSVVAPDGAATADATAAAAAPPSQTQEQPSPQPGDEPQGEAAASPPATAEADPESAAGAFVPDAASPQSLDGTIGGGGSSGAVGASKKKEKTTHVKSQLEKAEERKRQRMQRKALFDELLAKRPSAEQEDPRDVAAIQRAESSMGDKRLKTDDNYVVKETERVTAERKERQLTLLEESIQTLRLDFNERFLALRDLKERLIVSINKDMRKIDLINKQLRVDEPHEHYAMSDCEIPDKLRLTPPTKAQLQHFERERAKARRKAERDAKAKGGFGGDLGGNDEEEEADDAGFGGGSASVDDSDRIQVARRASLRVHNQKRESYTISAEMRMHLELKTKLERLPKSALEQEEEGMLRAKLLHERAKLERKIHKTVTTFDTALDELRREKIRLEGDLRMADMRIHLLYRELILLKDFKKKDESLTKKLEEHRAEKLEVTKRTNECQDRLNRKKVEIKQLLEVEQANMNSMLRLLSGLPQGVREALMKVFRKKVKRKAKKEGEEEEEEEEQESSDEDWDSNSDEANDEGEEDVCPDGCDTETYEAVLALRVRRLEQEEVVSEFQKSMDQLKKENEALTKREKATNSKLQQVEKEIQTFQTEKQQKLNQLETSIVLKLSQVQALTPQKKLPFDQSSFVVFTNTGMHDLVYRIGQLQTDKKALNREHNEYKRAHCQLFRQKKGAESRVKDWEQKVYEVQLLKFGQRVDLETLEDVSVDRQTEELKDRLRAEEAHWERAMRTQMHALKKLKEQQQSAISVNSKLLKELADMRQEQHRLEEQLNVSQNKILTRMAGGSRIATAADRANLKDLVVMQQREIDALKSEIAMLRRKGGHVYTPVVSKVVTEPAATAVSAPAASR